MFRPGSKYLIYDKISLNQFCRQKRKNYKEKVFDYGNGGECFAI